MGKLSTPASSGAREVGVAEIPNYAGLPAGFEALRVRVRAAGDLPAEDRTVLLRSSLREKLLQAGIYDPGSLGSGPLVSGIVGGGRAPHPILSPEGDAWVLKQFLRGGLLGRLQGARYWRPSRFLRELSVAVHAERSGVPTAPVLAFVLERSGFGSVRCWLLTRFLPGVRPLHEFFGAPDVVRVFRSAGEVVQCMHRSGIDHPDLHVANILISRDPAGAIVTSGAATDAVGGAGGAGALEEVPSSDIHEDGAPRAFILDWDRARVRAPGTWNPSANLLRLWRSVEKARVLGGFPDANGQRHGSFTPTPVAVRAFLRGYFGGQRSALAEARRYFEQRAPLIRWRAPLWRILSRRAGA